MRRVLLALAVVASLARAEAAVGVAVAVSPDTFLPRAVIPAGVELTFVQADPLAGHDLVSLMRGPDGAWLFATDGVMPVGSVSPVRGTSGLEPGQYPFTCTQHPQMNGVLVVV